MPTNKDMAVMVYAHPCTLMQYICKTPPHLVIVPTPLNENGKICSYQLFVIVLFNRILLYAIFLLQYALSGRTEGSNIEKWGQFVASPIYVPFCLRHLTNTSGA